MPLVNISIAKGRSASVKKKMLDIVHNALVDSIRIPDRDRNQRITEYDRAFFETPPEKSKNFTIVEITLFAGRSMEAKRALYRNITDGLNKGLGIDGNDVMIVLNEVPMENWGIRGGKPANEVDLGFNVKV